MRFSSFFALQHFNAFWSQAPLIGFAVRAPYLERISQGLVISCGAFFDLFSFS